MDEIQFLFDEIESKNIDDLRLLLDALKHPLLQRDTYVLRQFTRGVLHAMRHKEQVVAERVVAGSQVLVRNDHLQILRPSPKPLVHYEPAVPKAPVPEPVIMPRPVPSPFPAAPVVRDFPSDETPHRYVVISDKLTKRPLGSAVVSSAYALVEPELFPPDKLLLDVVLPEVVRNPDLVHHEELLVLLEKKAKKLGIPFADELVIKLRYYIIRDVLRLGRVEPLLRDRHVSKVMCHGYQEPVLVSYRGRELKTNVFFVHDAEVQSFMRSVLARTNPKADLKQSFIDYTVGNLRLQFQQSTKLSSAKFTITKNT